MKPTVTVGIPFHKSADPLQLEKAIKSILSQTRKPDVIHLIQDGDISEDIKEVLRTIDDPSIVHIHFEENKGLAYVLNHSIKKAKTKYYARMDADDISYPERLDKQIEYLEATKIDILGSWTLDIDNQNEEQSLRKVPIDHNDIVKNIWTCPLIHPTVTFRLSSIRETALYNSKLKRRQDYEFWYRCVKEGLKFGNLPEPLLKYRYSEDWFKKNTPKVIWDQVKMGWRGNKLVNASFTAYLGVMFPLIKILMPPKLGIKLNDFFKNFDPRDVKT